VGRRETLQRPATSVGSQDTTQLVFDPNDQANSATLGHAQGMSIANTPAQADIVCLPGGEPFEFDAAR
jgi:hypothetical protein